MNYFIISIFKNKKSEISKKAFQLGCLGIVNDSFLEDEIEKIIGDNVYCKEKLSERLFKEIEDSTKGEEKFFFGNKKEVDQFKNYLSEMSISFDEEEKEEEDWNLKWKSYYKEVEITEDLKIVPIWKKKKNKNNEIYINPGMGFGIGTHETTFLCLKLFEKNKELYSKKCLDLGCGSGVLGITAIKRKKNGCNFL